MNGPGRLHRRWRSLAFAGGVVLVVLLTFVLEPFRDYQLATAAAYLCAVAGLTALTGWGGQLSVGHNTFMAVGAYTAAMVQNQLPGRGAAAYGALVLALAGGTAAATVSGLIVAGAAARLRGPYLAGATLAVAVAAPELAIAFSSVFKGDQGVPVDIAVGPQDLGSIPYERWQAWLALACAVPVLVVLANARRGRLGRQWQALRDDEVAARLCGIGVYGAQVSLFTLSAACAGLGGAVLAFLSLSVTPGAFTLRLSLSLFLAMAVGGVGSLGGAVWGSLVLVLVPDALSSLTDSNHLPPELAARLAGNLPLALYGLLLIALMFAAPGGIQALLTRLALTVRTRMRRKASDRLEGNR